MERSRKCKGAARKVGTPSCSSRTSATPETSPCCKKGQGAVCMSKLKDGKNDFFCWMCHRDGQVICCEFCPRVYHSRCLKLAAEPEGDWTCPVCEKIVKAESMESRSKATMILTQDQLAYLLKSVVDKMKQPGDHLYTSSRSTQPISTQKKSLNWTEPFQHPVSLEQYPDYADYIFHPMDLCTIEMNIENKSYGCTDAFLADVKWILHNCIIYNGGNHQLSGNAKMIMKICEYEMNEIEVCPECCLSACQNKENWFCEPCNNPHTLVWAKVKGFPFWPAKALREKDGQVDARFFGQHNRAWVLSNNCYFMSKELPFSMKKTKSIFNNAMKEMEIYIENLKKKFGIFNYAPLRTPYTPDTTFQVVLDLSKPSSGPGKPEKQENIELNLDVPESTKSSSAKTVSEVEGTQGCPGSCCLKPALQSSDEEKTMDKSQVETPNNQNPSGGEALDCSISLACPHPGPACMSLDGPEPMDAQASAIPEQDTIPLAGSILDLSLSKSVQRIVQYTRKDESKAEKQKQALKPFHAPFQPKLEDKIRFQMNLKKTLEKAQMSNRPHSVDACERVEHSDLDDSARSGSSENEEVKPETPASKSAASRASATLSDSTTKEKRSKVSEETTKKIKAPPASTATREKTVVIGDMGQTVPVKDAERQLVLDPGEEQRRKDRKRSWEDSTSAKDSSMRGKFLIPAMLPSQRSTAPWTPLRVSKQFPMAIPATMVSSASPAPATISFPAVTERPALPRITPPAKKRHPLVPCQLMPMVQRAFWNPAPNSQTSSQKWFMSGAFPPGQSQAQVIQGQADNGSPEATLPSTSTQYQTKQTAKGAVQQQATPCSTSAMASSGPASIPMMATSNLGTAASSSSVASDPCFPNTAVGAQFATCTNKMADALKDTMTELCVDLSTTTSKKTVTEAKGLQNNMERLQWQHQQEMSDMKHNFERTMAEMRQSLEQERVRMVSEVRKQMELEKQKAMDEMKKKQWCANCKNEAAFYCCWNTSYCNYPCQIAHWPEHMKNCTQSASAPLQRSEPRVPNTSSGQTSSGPNSLRDKTTPAPSDKDTDTKNCTENATS